MNTQNQTNETDTPVLPDNPALRVPLSTFRRRHTGKVARLPAKIRHIVNIMLYNGAYYTEIVQRLNELGYPGIIEQNISRWRLGGYKDWLRDNRESAELQRHTETLLELAKDPNSGISLQNANDALIGIRLLQALLRFDSNKTSGLADGDLSAFFKLARATNSRLAEHNRRDSLDLARLKLTSPSPLNGERAGVRGETVPPPANDLSDTFTPEDIKYLKIACDRIRQALVHDPSWSEGVQKPGPANTAATPANTQPPS